MAIDLAAVQTEAVALLNGQDLATLAFWDGTDLAGYMDELAQDLGRNNRLIAAKRDATVSAGVSSYAWPAQHVAAAAVLSVGTVVSEASIAEMEALDPDWQQDTGRYPSHWVGNWQGLQVFRFYPTPDTNGDQYSVIALEHPDQVTAVNLTVDFPSVLGELFVLHTVMKALKAETRGARRETAQMIEQMMSPIEQLVSKYWGM